MASRMRKRSKQLLDYWTTSNKHGMFRAAADVLAAIQKTMSKHSATAVTVTGHSLGPISSKRNNF